MSSLRRIQSSRANGARSRGPVTPEGKRRVSQNALKHGLLAAQCVVLPHEPPDGFQATFADYLERFAPSDELELGMVEEMASAYWRLRRAWVIENQLLTDGMGRQSGKSGHQALADAF